MKMSYSILSRLLMWIMENLNSVFTIILLFSVFIKVIESTPTLMPTGHVCIYPGQRKMFTCQVTYSNNVTNRRLLWRVHFQDSPNRNNITAVFVPSDQVGYIVQNQHMFVFNLTSNTMYSLESTMTLTISTFISNTVVACKDSNSEVSEQAVLHLQINDGLSSSVSFNCPSRSSISETGYIMNLTFGSQLNALSSISNNFPSKIPCKSHNCLLCLEKENYCNSDRNNMRYMIVATAVTVVLLGLLFIILLGILIKKAIRRHNITEYTLQNVYSELPLTQSERSMTGEVDSYANVRNSEINPVTTTGRLPDSNLSM